MSAVPRQRSGETATGFGQRRRGVAAEVAVEPAGALGQHRRRVHREARRRRVAVETDPELLRPGERAIGVERLVDPEGEVAAALHHEHRRLDALQRCQRRARPRRTATTAARFPANAASRSASTSGSTRFGSSAPRKPAITPDFARPCGSERLTQVGPADRDLERRPRHPRDERVPGRAAAVRDAPAADASVRDVGAVAQPGEHGARRRRSPSGRRSRSGRPTRRARGRRRRARRIARRCPSPAQPRGRPPGLPEAVHEDHSRASRRSARGPFGTVSVAAMASAVRRCDRHVLAKGGCRRPCGGEGDEECEERDQRASAGRHGAEG